MKSNPYYTYMLRCQDNSLYTGITVDVERRMSEHFRRDKKCARYTLTHPAKKLEGVWKSENRILASKLEFQIKKLTKKQKEYLLSGNHLEELLSDKIEVEKYRRIK